MSNEKPTETATTAEAQPEHGRFDVVGWHDARALPINARPPGSWPCHSRWNGHECSLYDQHAGTHIAAADNSGRVIAEWSQYPAAAPDDVIGLREIAGWAVRNFPDSWPVMDTATKAQFATRVRKAGREADWCAIYREIKAAALASTGCSYCEVAR